MYPMSTKELFDSTQEKYQHLEWTPGGGSRALNPSKCVWAHFCWENNNAFLQLAELNCTKEYQLYNSTYSAIPTPLSNSTQPLYTGIWVYNSLMNRNWTVKLTMLQQCNNKYTQMLIHCHFTKKEANMVY